MRGAALSVLNPFTIADVADIERVPSFPQLGNFFSRRSNMVKNRTGGMFDLTSAGVGWLRLRFLLMLD